VNMTDYDLDDQDDDLEDDEDVETWQVFDFAS